METFVITGHDTNIGKTFVSRLLVEYLLENNKSVQFVKPVESGSSLENFISDSDYVSYNNHSDKLTHSVLYSFKAPLAPNCAARLENNPLILESILKKLEALPKDKDYRIIEIAGGHAGPIDESGNDWNDFLQIIKPQLLILIIENRLGAQNQSRLLEYYTRGLGLQRAMILNDVKPRDNLITQSNYHVLNQLNIPILAHIEYQSKRINFLQSHLCLNSYIKK